MNTPTKKITDRRVSLEAFGKTKFGTVKCEPYLPTGSQMTLYVRVQWDGDNSEHAEPIEILNLVRSDMGKKRKPEVKELVTPEDYMKFNVGTKGYRLITSFKHVGNYHNFTVICVLKSLYYGKKKYVVWNYNGCNGINGFYSGFYCHGDGAENEAVGEFNMRVKAYGNASAVSGSILAWMITGKD